MKNISLIYIFVLLIFFSCKKETTPYNPYAPTQDPEYTFNILDDITHLPIPNAYVDLTYGNAFSASAHADSNGKATFRVPGGYIINDIRVFKAGYCDLHHTYNNSHLSRQKNVYVKPVSYIRFNVNNLNSPDNADLIRIYYIGPELYDSPPPVSYTGQVSTSNIVVSQTGNLNFYYTVWSGATELYTQHIDVVTIGRDTIDVNINY